VLTDSAELDDQPDYLGSTPEGQLHTSFHVVPATLRDDHENPFYLSAERFPLGRPGDPTARCGPTISVAGLRTIEAWRRRSQVYRRPPAVEKTHSCKY